MHPKEYLTSKSKDMNAKEFEPQWRKDNHIQGSPYKLSKSENTELMEAYHRAKVEAVTKNQIKKEASKCWLPADFEAGAKYVKDKLLNQ